ncbi:MAG: 30S ribosomal protein S6e [Candidatus Micrarchaeia archaeon]|jgi:small subunit ribosomal protein S6e
MKIVIGNKDGKSYQIEIQDAGMLMGKKVGDQIEGDQIGVPGFTFQITGGSDLSGFPMRFDVDGPDKHKILMAKGPGFKKERAGERRKKTIHGKQISQDINQINIKIIKEGPTNLAKLLGKEEEPKEENKEKE